MDSKWWICVRIFFICLLRCSFRLMTFINIPDVFMSELPAENNFLCFVAQHAYGRPSWFIARQNTDERTGTRRYSCLCLYLLDRVVVTPSWRRPPKGRASWSQRDFYFHSQTFPGRVGWCTVAVKHLDILSTC